MLGKGLFHEVPRYIFGQKVFNKSTTCLFSVFSDRRRGFEGCSQRSVCSRRIVRSSGWPTSYRHIGQYKSIALLGVSSEFVGDCSCVLKSPARLFQSNDKKYQQVVSRSELPSRLKNLNGFRFSQLFHLKWAGGDREPGSRCNSQTSINVLRFLRIAWLHCLIWI